jgi:hypothetical protein
MSKVNLDRMQVREQYGDGRKEIVVTSHQELTGLSGRRKNVDTNGL